MALVASAGRIRTDALSTLEASVLTRVQSACNFANAEAARLRHQTIAIWAMCLAGLLILWVVTGFGDAHIALVVAAGVGVMALVRARAELASSVEKIATKRIIAGLSGQLSYKPTSSLTREQFVATDLFTDRCGRWTSRHEIAGKARGTRYSLHQVRANGKDRRNPIFDGVILKLDLSDGFPGHTVIVPARGGEPPAAPGNSAAPRRKKDFVMVKNPQFERLFDVYSTDYYEAKKLVTDRFMDVVMDAQSRLGELRMCFARKSLFVAIAGQALRFEATLFADPLTPQTAVGPLLPLVALAHRLADTRS